MLRDTRDAYGWIAIVLHWAMAVLFVSQLALGFVMIRIADQRASFDLIQLHKSFGFVILSLAILRIMWRLGNARPDLPAAMSWLERRAARAAHVLLYGAQVVLPLSGWALVSVSVLDIPSMPFGLFVMPHLPLAASDAAERFWTAAHGWIALAAAVLIGAHAVAAIRHHLWLRDGVLMRMILPATARRRE